MVRWIVEELAKHHDRGSFSCGHTALDEYVKRFAGQNHRSALSKTFVAVGEDQVEVCGYYTISAGSVEFEHVPEELKKRFPRYPIPVAHIGRLAVDQQSQGTGLGSFLLIDAFARCVKASELLGIHAVEVIAKDEVARAFYLKYGFVSLLDDQLHLYLPMAKIQKLDL